MSETLWLYKVDDATEGPITETELTNLVNSGVLTAASKAREYSSTGSWGTLAGLRPELVGASAAEATAERNAWRETPARPWRRYLARLLDYSLLGTIVLIIVDTILYIVSADTYLALQTLLAAPLWGSALSTFLAIILTIPAAVLLIGMTGYTPGKWLFGVRVVGSDNRPIGIWRATRRELTLWVLGLAAGLPLISYLAAIFSFRQLIDTRPAIWDRQAGSKVIYRPAGRRQTLWLVVGLVFIALLRLLALIPASAG